MDESHKHEKKQREGKLTPTHPTPNTKPNLTVANPA